MYQLTKRHIRVVNKDRKGYVNYELWITGYG
jgi:hypothetical protein